MESIDDSFVSVKSNLASTQNPETPGDSNKVWGMNGDVSLTVDKLAIGITRKSEHLFGVIHEHVKYAKQLKPSWLEIAAPFAKGFASKLDIIAPNSSVKTTKSNETGKAMAKVNVSVPSKDGKKLGDEVYARVEWNPAHWNAEDAIYLCTALDWLLHVSSSDTYIGDVLGKARVLKLHLAADFPGVDLRRFVWTEKHPCRACLIHDGELQTVYTGPFASTAKSRANHFCIYDKAAEAGLPGVLTRVEARYGTPKVAGHPMRLNALSDAKNLFASLRCADLKAAFAAAKFPPPAYHDICAAAFAVLGIDRAQELIPEGEGGKNPRKVLAKAINDTTPSFWNPAELWKLLPAAASRVFPDVLTFEQP